MLTDYLQNTQKRIAEKLDNFYTPGGIHVYIQEPLTGDNIDIETLIGRLEDLVPQHLRSEIEMVIIGWFSEFGERNINAFYKDGALYVSNVQDDSEDLFDDLVHEVAHSIESIYGYEIYGDQKVKNEFLRKRKYLHDMLWQKGYKAPLDIFMNSEYDKDFDMFLYKKVGYDKLSSICQGLFVSAYAPTSLQEYFATGFTEYYLNSNHDFLKRVSPQLYKKLLLLHNPEKLDNSM
jgi:hypothetical protein